MFAKSTIKIELLAGSDIKEAFTEALRIAKILDVWVDFDFNYVKCSISPTGNPDEGAKMYFSAQKSEDKDMKIAIC
jgi:sugar/nucleoside kinase (ribokinase family)